MKELQLADSFCKEVIHFLTTWKIKDKNEPFWVKQIEKFKINENGLLVREIEPIGKRRGYL